LKEGQSSSSDSRFVTLLCERKLRDSKLADLEKFSAAERKRSLVGESMPEPSFPFTSRLLTPPGPPGAGWFLPFGRTAVCTTLSASSSGVCNTHSVLSSAGAASISEEVLPPLPKPLLVAARTLATPPMALLFGVALLAAADGLDAPPRPMSSIAAEAAAEAADGDEADAPVPAAGALPVVGVLLFAAAGLVGELGLVPPPALLPPDFAFAFALALPAACALRDSSDSLAPTFPCAPATGDEG